MTTSDLYNRLQETIRLLILSGEEAGTIAAEVGIAMRDARSEVSQIRREGLIVAKRVQRQSQGA